MGNSSKQLRRYYEHAAKGPQQTNVALVQSLETRLDNMVYRMDSRAHFVRQDRWWYTAPLP
ncbi:MAG: hypothetical protein Ct9H300mP28_20180 [Pseudomonadota bacterium]|nr:MAG: hypothetical protein Ct9H300mP28_20180 [Pseudomonadota bacterium]